MAQSYRAVQAVRPGELEITQRPVVDPPTGHVRIRVETCGVCHSDVGTVEGVFPIQWPRVPGHEAVGRIDWPGGFYRRDIGWRAVAREEAKR